MIKTADFNNDGIMDIVSASGAWQSPSLSVLIGNGDGTFDPAADIAVTIMSGSTIYSVTTATLMATAPST